MAYLKNLFDYLDQQNGGQGNSNPMLSASSTQIDTAPQGMATPNAKPAPGSGTGSLGGTRSNKWVNIQDFMGANPSLSGMAKSKGQEFIGNERNNFNSAAKPLRDASFGAKKYSDAEIEDLLTPGGAYDVDAIKNAYNQNYTGPMGVDYDAFKSGNLDKAKMVANRTTAMDVLAEPYIKQGSYGTGLRNLDQSLLGADQEYGNVSTGLSKEMKDFLGYQQSETEKLNQKAAQYKQQGDEARQQTQTGVKNFSDKALQKLRDDADAANAAERQRKINSLKAYTGWWQNIMPDIEAQKKRGTPQNAHFYEPNFAVLKGGNQANYQNIGDDNQYAGLNNARSIQGLDAIAHDGQFQKAGLSGPETFMKSDGTYKNPYEIAAEMGITLEDAGGFPTADRVEYLKSFLPPGWEPGVGKTIHGPEELNREWLATNPELAPFYEMIWRSMYL